jgi:hypothetical protein
MTLPFFFAGYAKANFRTKLGKYVESKLPSDYLVHQGDADWIDTIDSFWNGEKNKKSIKKACDLAVDKYGITMHCDPYELFIDAKLI